MFLKILNYDTVILIIIFETNILVFIYKSFSRYFNNNIPNFAILSKIFILILQLIIDIIIDVN